MQIKHEITNALLEGKASEVKTLVEVAVQLGLSPTEVVDSVMLPAMEIIGEKFKQNRLYIPDVLMASRAMQAGLYALEPFFKSSSQVLKPRVVIGTVAGDLHDIGKRLVIMSLQAAGMEVIDLGIDISPETFVQAVKEYEPDILGMSALLTMTMPALAETIQALHAHCLRDKVKVIVGGSPVTNDYALEIGADGYAGCAYDAVNLIKMLV
ncbi:cobalamin B12-binding domain-containing protein [Zhaonella formicivorans]|uniref:cobalamin B12-binding domain-containing protein n=1 Tax=Zhaonella formicivorans TaxID=2528593 RepID=UPI0010DEC0B7|nr:corrinoid protein [Zhaonella formicivorans]